MRFVKQDDAVCDVMQLSAIRRLCGKERFKELDGGGNDDRVSPSCAELPFQVCQITLAVVFQNMRQDIPVGFCALLRQRQEWKHKNDSLFPPSRAVP